MRPLLRLPVFALIALIALIGLAATHRAAAAPVGHALVIGNAAYQGETPLVNTLNDARDMAAKLNKLGFEVTKVENAGRSRLTRAVNDFHRLIQRDDKPALLYYSGHGMQLAGTNYLIPVDARIRDELDVSTEGVSLNRLLDGLRGRADDAINLVVLDACRDNPFKKDDNKSIGGKGLSRVKAPRGTLILYAASPGETASDNPGGRNGLFTQYLLRAMDQPGMQVEQTFKQVAYNVYRDSGKRQSPWQEGVIYGRFYFVPPPPLPPPPHPPAPVGPVDYDGLAWQAAVQCGRPACYQAYLRDHPGGRFAAMARALLAPAPSPPAVAPPAPDPAAAVAATLRTCRTHLDANRLTTGAGGNALACYQKVLGEDPNNAAALAGIAAIEARYARWADGNLTRGRFDRVARYLERIAAVNPDSPRLAELQQRLEAARTAAPSTPAAAPAGGRRQPFEPEMVRVPGGSFQMGSNAGDSNEKPVHRVRVQPFLIGKYEVTRGQFRAFVDATGYRTDAEKNAGGKEGCVVYNGGTEFVWKAGASWRDPGFAQREDHPVVCISWNDARQYIAWLNRQTAKDYRLPSEAEWEYAARAGSTGKYSFGDDPADLCRYGNVGDRTLKARFSTRPWPVAPCSDGQPFTAKVGSFAPNAFGLRDIHGNVWEWTGDCWNDSYGGAPADGSAWTGGDCGRRVFRGGSWLNDPGGLRSADRTRYARGYRFWDVGLRLARAI